MLFLTVMVSWRMGRGLLQEQLAAHSPPVREFLAGLPAQLRARAAGTAVCMASLADRVPSVLTRMVRRFGVVHEQVILLHVDILPEPHVPVD